MAALSNCFLGDDFTVIQQEILMMRDCRHENIVAYLGSYLRYLLYLSSRYALLNIIFS